MDNNLQQSNTSVEVAPAADPFLTLINNELPEDKVVKTHSTLLDEGDARTRLGAVKLAYQLRNRIGAEQVNLNNIQITYRNKPEVYEDSKGEVVDIQF